MKDADTAAAKASPQDCEKMDSNQICAFLDRLLESAPMSSTAIEAMRMVGERRGWGGQAWVKRAGERDALQFPSFSGSWDRMLAPVLFSFSHLTRQYKLGESGNTEIRFRWQVSVCLE
jgi:hypothetical protein